MPGKMVVEQFGPDVEIKISGREQQDSEWQDLKGDFVAVSTSRKINSPAGAWALTLVSRRDNQGRTWAKRIRPMDYIEIRFGRYKKRGQKPQMIMRGFVDKLTETIGIGGDGKPQRQITISGKDMGKLLLLKQVYILAFGSQAALTLQKAIEANNSSEKAIFDAAWSDFLNKPWVTPQEFLDKVKAYVLTATSSGAGEGTGVGPTQTVANVPEMEFKAKDLDEFFVSPVVLKTLIGPVWNLISHYHGMPVCEIIVHDTEDKPELIWRWAAYKGSDGKILKPSTESGEPTVISSKTIMQYTIETTDNDMATFYFTFPKQAQVIGNQFHNASEGPGNPTYRQQLADRYGFKPLEIQFPLMKLFGHPIEEKMVELRQDWQTMGKQVSEWADKAFSHSVRLEGGTLVLRGDERLDIGTYVKIKETTQEFYIEGIRHDFTLNPPRFTSTLEVSRGLWLENNPYPVDEGESTSGSLVGGNEDGTADPQITRVDDTPVTLPTGST